MRENSSPDQENKIQQTQNHYDSYPYNVGVQNSDVYFSLDSPIGRFLSKSEGKIVVDLGCGPGNLLPAILLFADYVIGVDLSINSLRYAVEAVPSQRVRVVQANILELPFATNSVDILIAAGSLHHTPDARTGFQEACRILRPSGRGFFALYQTHSYYYYVYHILGSVARCLEKNSITKWFVNRFIILPVFLVYFVAGRLMIHSKLQLPTYQQLMNYFADQILNPVVSFHSISEIREWVRTEDVEIDWITSSHAGALVNFEIIYPVRRI